MTAGVSIFGVSPEACRGVEAAEQLGTNPSSRNRCIHGEAADPVNTASGNFHEPFEALSIPSRGPGVGFGFAYNSLTASTTAGLGKGWSWNYGMKLRFDPTRRTVVQEGGSEVGFTSGIGSSWVAPNRFDATLEQNTTTGEWLFVRNRSERFTFDSTGTLMSIADRNGYATTLTYDGSGLLASAVDDAGHTLTFTWTGTPARLTAVSDSASPARSVALAYDTLKDELTSYTAIDGGVWRFEYDSDHWMTAMIDPEQSVLPNPAKTLNTYDPSGRVATQTDRLGGIWNFDYTTVANATKITSPAGHVTLDTYQGGVRTAHTAGYGSPTPSTWNFEYDPRNTGLTKVTDPNGDVTTATYDLPGRCLSVTTPAGTTKHTYNAAGDIATSTDAMGVTTTYSYDPNGNPTSVSTPLVGSSPAVSQTTTFSYDPAKPGDLTSVVDPRQKTWTFTYDAPTGMLQSATDPLGNKTTSAYDTIGRLTSTVDPRGNAAGATPANHRTSYTYASNGAVASATTPKGEVTQMTYDYNGNLETSTGPDNHVVTFAYDAENRPLTEQQPDSSITATAYWPDGSVRTQTDAAGAATTYTYDVQGRLAASTDPAGRVTAYSYDPGGRLITQQQPGGSCTAPKTGCITYGYDQAGRTTLVDYSDPAPQDVTFAYDANGRRTSMTVAGQPATTSSWDSLGRLKSVVDPDGKTTGYGYTDRGDQPTTVTYPDGKTITRTYDDAGRQTATTDWTGAAVSFGYDPASNLTTTNNPSTTGVEDSFAFDHDNQLESTTIRQGVTQLASLLYSRNSRGLVTAYTGTGLPSDTFTYNSQNMLATDSTGSYGYDQARNLTSLPGGTKQKFNTANELCYTATTNTADCGLAPAGSTKFDYTDGRGNRTATRPANQVPTTLAYDQANQMIQAKVPSLPDGSGQYHDLSQASGWYTAGESWTANQVKTYQVSGAKGIPASGVESVVLRLHVASPANYGYLTAFPAGGSANGTVGMYTNPGESASNLAVSTLSGDGKVSVQTTVATLISVELVGWYGSNNASGGLTFEPVTATRAFSSAVGGGSTSPIPVSGSFGIPATGVSAVAVVLHSAATGTSGYLKIYSGPTAPATASLLYDSGSASAMTIVPLAADGTLKLYTTAATTAALDIVGYYTAVTSGSGNIAHTVAPAFIADTYNHTGTCVPAPCSRLVGGSTPVPVSVDVTGVNGIPATGVAAVAVVMQALLPDGPGSLTAYASGTPMPDAATMNFDDAFSSGTAIVRVGADGTITLVADVGVDILVQAVGYFDPATKTYQYTYTGDGLRRTKTAPDGTLTTFTWDRSTSVPLLLTEAIDVPGGTSNDRIVRYLYGPDSTVTSDITTKNGVDTIRWYHHDQLGSTRMLTGSTGAVLNTFSYTPLGLPSAALSTTQTTPLGWAGEYRDTETGYTYLRARYYDPATAQFLTRDPLEALTRSPYGYAAGDPVNVTDPSGMCPFCVAFVVGALIGGGTDLAFQAGGNLIRGCGAFDNVSWRSVAFNAALGGVAGLGGAWIASGGGRTVASRFLSRVNWADDAGMARLPGLTPRFSADQDALIQLAKGAQRTGVDATDARTLLTWAKELGLKARGPEIHPGRPWGQFPHIHIGPINHIPVL